MYINGVVVSFKGLKNLVNKLIPSIGIEPTIYSPEHGKKNIGAAATCG